MEKRKIRGLGIRAKILLPASAVIILLCTVMEVNSYKRTEEGLIEMGVEEAQMAATISTKVIDAKLVAEMSAEKKKARNTMRCWKLCSMSRRIAESNIFIPYIRMEPKYIMELMQIIRKA